MIWYLYSQIPEYNEWRITTKMKRSQIQQPLVCSSMRLLGLHFRCAVGSECEVLLGWGPVR